MTHQTNYSALVTLFKARKDGAEIKVLAEKQGDKYVNTMGMVITVKEKKQFYQGLGYEVID